MSFSVIVMAAGQGTRMKSKTPKVLHEICGRPMVHWPVLAAREAGAGTIVVVGGPGGELEGKLPEGVTLAVQPVADGTGGAVAAGIDQVPADEDVVILSGDVPLITAEAIEELLQAHRESKAAATMATMRLRDPAGYGRVVRTAEGDIERVVETKDESDATSEELEIREVNTGVFCFRAAMLAAALPQVGSDNAQGERYLPDVLPVLRSSGETIAGHPISEMLVRGINDREDLARVTSFARLRILRDHMQAGVTVLDPASTSIDADVTIGADTILEAGTVLRGNTTIGEACSVGPQVTLTDCALHSGVTIRHAFAVEAVAHDGVTIGPFAYLRPGTVLHEGSKVGTFVEVKNSEIGAGSKIPHLSYIGDADVGEDTNLGASTITANYDGRHKHRTTIGSRVRSSVDVAFVAPVTIGDDAVTGAGSVITSDVPPGALGIARAGQQNVEGYAARKRAEAAAEDAPDA